ncbi:MAG: TIGR00725 family protein [Desulfuromonas sp.]|nr:MAG: TIGR00725 family protein [Desulfuromonas sp.]
MNSNRRRLRKIGVIGSSRPSDHGLELAEQVGRLIACNGALLICGGLGGVMEAASKGCAEAGGEVIGIVPGADCSDVNPYVTICLPTNMGHARNVIIAHAADALVAIEGEYGTLSEIAISLKLGKKVVVLPGGQSVDGVLLAANPQLAVAMAMEQVES